MAHVDLPSGDVGGDVGEAGTVFGNRSFVFLWSAQTLSQLASNMVLAALMATVHATTGSDTAVAVLLLTFLVPAVLFSTVGGVLVERSNAKVIMLATNIVRAVGIIAFIFVAPSTASANVPLIYLINFGIATATAVFAPAELTAIPRIVDRRHLMAANSIFVLTINATFAIGFGFFGPLVLNVLGPIGVYVIVAVMFGVAALAILPLPAVRPDHAAASAGAAAGRALHELVDQLAEGMAFVRRHRAIAWSLAYLGISSSLIGVLGAIGPGFAVDILGLTSQNFFFIMGPAGLGAVVGILFLNSYGKGIPKRLVIDVGLVAMGITLVMLAIIKPVTIVFGGAAGPIEDAVPVIAPLISLITVVVVIAVFAGLEYAFVAIPSQTALQEDIPSEVRGRIFGILNTLLSVASFLPVIAAPAAADILNIFFDGAGIPIVMAFLGVLTFWAGVASWRRNSRQGLHQHDRGMPPADTIDEMTAPGIPDVADPAARPEAPHRRRRRRRSTTDGD
ncbi:MAG: MFS transporter [Chloroflexi bacterium]|nr:MFS transporter [Chloroflexota bacterium]MBA3740649.1 MFS transporter [Chloroflexota bacterium]